MYYPQHSTSMRPQKRSVSCSRRGPDIASMVVQLRCHWLRQCFDDNSGIDASVGILHSARCYSVPEACLLPFHHVLSRSTNDCSFLFIVVYTGAVLEGIVWESKSFLSKALFKSRSTLVDLLVFQSRHCAMRPPQPGCSFHVEDLVHKDVGRITVNDTKQHGNNLGTGSHLKVWNETDPGSKASTCYVNVGGFRWNLLWGHEKMACPVHTPVSSNGKPS